MTRRKRKAGGFPWPAVGVVIIGGILFLPGVGTLIGALCVFTGVSLLAVASFVEARRRHRWQTVSSFYSLSPEEFERHVGDLYRLLGYSVRFTPRVGDQGVDVLASRGNESIAIQCKRYADKASNAAVQAVHSGRVHHNCNRAALVCLGGFSDAAKVLAGSTNVELIDGEQYANLVHRLSGERMAFFAMPPFRTAAYAVAIVGVGAVAFAFDHFRTIPH